MEILGKKSNRMSRANVGVSENSEFPNLQRILDFLSLRNLASNELFFTVLSGKKLGKITFIVLH